MPKDPKARVNPNLADLLFPIEKLYEDERNARLHTERNIASIRNSLAEFGQQKPIVALVGGKVVAGNGTLRAAKELGWKKIAVVRFDGTEEEALAYAIADNRTAELASWDAEELQRAVERLAASGVDLGKFGFSGTEIEAIFGRPMDDGSGETTTPTFGPSAAPSRGRTVVCPKCGFEFEVPIGGGD